jgi:hypothetical protein
MSNYISKFTKANGDARITALHEAIEANRRDRAFQTSFADRKNELHRESGDLLESFASEPDPAKWQVEKVIALRSKIFGQDAVLDNLLPAIVQMMNTRITARTRAALATAFEGVLEKLELELEAVKEADRQTAKTFGVDPEEIASPLRKKILDTIEEVRVLQSRVPSADMNGLLQTTTFLLG